MRKLIIWIDGEEGDMSLLPLGDSGAVRYLGITAAGCYVIENALKDGKKVEIKLSNYNEEYLENER